MGRRGRDLAGRAWTDSLGGLSRHGPPQRNAPRMAWHEAFPTDPLAVRRRACPMGKPSGYPTMYRMRLPGWIIIGATGRNSGKTEFACLLIKGLSQMHPVIGVKVTAIREGEATCPRSGEGCGACSTLDRDFILSEEHGEPLGKDTTRMLESGAHRVFWLRGGQARLRGAVEALVSRLDPGQLVVAESNSLAQVVEPDLFLMVRDGTSSSIKPTAAAVISMANRVVVSDGKAFDLSLQQLSVVDGVCRLVEASSVILASGDSRRMGQDKSMLPVKGKPLIRRAIIYTPPDVAGKPPPGLPL